jgi:RNA polymerase sigma factor for flagellar operon FliA
MQTVQQSIWEEYARNQTPVLKRELVMAYLPLVRYVVSKLGVPSSHTSSLVKESDLVQFGVLGLLEAIERYQPGRGVKFETYAIPRIRGMVQDELRKLDWVPRSVRRKARLVDRVAQQVGNASGEEGASEAIAEKLSLTEEECKSLMEEAHLLESGMQHVHDDGEILDNIASEDHDQLEVLGDEEAKTVLVDMIDHLPSRQRLVVTMYYYENLTFRQIAGLLGLSDSRVFQIHATVLRHLREQLKEYR